MDKHFQKEYEKKQGKASEDYLAYIYALSLIDGSHKQHLKIMRNAVKHFEDLPFCEDKSIPEEKMIKMIKIIAGQYWANGFHWAIKHLDILKQSEDLRTKK